MKNHLRRDHGATDETVFTPELLKKGPDQWSSTADKEDLFVPVFFLFVNALLE